MDLKENEKVLFELELTENRKEYISSQVRDTLIITSFPPLILWVMFYLSWTPSERFLLLFNMNFFYFMIFVIIIHTLFQYYLFLESPVRFSRSKYYLTNMRVVRILGKGWLYRCKSRRSIELSRVSFFRLVGDRVVYIMELQKDGTPHYTGAEEDSKHPGSYIFWKSIKVEPFMSEREKEKREGFKENLIDVLNAAQHPHLDDIYVPEKYLKEDKKPKRGVSIKEKILKTMPNEKFLSFFMGCLTIGIFFYLMYLSLTAQSIDFLEIMLLELLLIGSLSQYVSLDCLNKVFSDQLNGKISRTQQAKDAIIGFGILISAVLPFYYLVYPPSKMSLLSLLWSTIYVGLPGLWRWWFSRSDQGEKSILKNVLKIEGLLTFTYSVLLISIGPFFLEFSILRMLSAFPLLSGGISSILLGIFGEWEED